MKREYTKREQWFIDRIGKRIYRDHSGCTCKVCESIAKNGIIVDDEYHALYLAEIEGSFATDGRMLNYRDEL